MPISTPTTVIPSLRPLPAVVRPTKLPILNQTQNHSRRTLLLTTTTILTHICSPAIAAVNDDYIKDTTAVINKIRFTMGLEKTDPNVPTAVADLRSESNQWVAKYRKEKSLLGRSSYRDIYSALNAVSGHYISFGPSAPIPNKRKLRILEEINSAENALTRGR